MAMRWMVGVCVLAVAAAAASGASQRGNVIFLHPDGASAATWTAARAMLVGPDGELEWDKLEDVAVYTGHVRDCLTPSSNGGGTVHAYGRKVDRSAYGMTRGGSEAAPIVDANGETLSIARQAMAAGCAVGLVQSGTSVEPGTGCFLASTPSREMHDAIAAQLVASGAAVLMGGGERHFLPEGVMGVHGPGVRTDGRDLIAEALKLRYTVVYTRADLARLPRDTTKVLGLFASWHTFNAMSEERLAEEGKPLYDPDAPTLAEMTRVALRVLTVGGRRFMLVVEEEGTDNFGNHNNASGVFEAARRADEAIGVCVGFGRRRPDTLVLTTADSDAGGMRMVGLIPDGDGNVAEILPERDDNGGPIDGVGGAGTAPFVAQPDRFGNRLRFGVRWASMHDVSGGVVVRAAGLNSHHVRGTMDNTEVAELMRLTLIGEAATAE